MLYPIQLDERGQFMKKRGMLLGSFVIVGLLGFGLLQVFQPSIVHNNPAVVSEPNWQNATAKEIAVRACFDCHSNQTNWPWYSKIAPVSWLLAKDVVDGRAVLNFSEWKPQIAPSAELVRLKLENGSMPKPQYLALHAEARLTQQEINLLISEWEKLKK
jgi:hypothetical protein